MPVSARNEQNEPVDFWFAYKVPKLANASGGTEATGYEYAYFDRQIGAVKKSPNLMSDGRGALFYTLYSVFGLPTPTIGWILYNDEMPPDADRSNNDTLVHTKGVIALIPLASPRSGWSTRGRNTRVRAPLVCRRRTTVKPSCA